MSNDYDVIVLGAGLPGRALRGGARRGRPARRGGRARARRRRVLLLGLHPVEDVAAPGRGGARGARGRGERRGRRRGGARLAGLHGLRPHRRRGGPLACRSRHRAAARQRPAAGPGVVEVDGVRHTAEHVVLANGADPVVPPVPGLRELDGVWTQPRGDGDEGGTAPPADPRRRAGRAWRWGRRCAGSAARRS